MIVMYNHIKKSELEMSFVKVMVFNNTLNNSSVTWPSVLLVEETWIPGENHLTNFNDIIVFNSLPWTEFKLNHDCIGSCKSNYHTFTCMTTKAHLGIYNNYNFMLKNILFRNSIFFLILKEALIILKTHWWSQILVSSSALCL